MIYMKFVFELCTCKLQTDVCPDKDQYIYKNKKIICTGSESHSHDQCNPNQEGRRDRHCRTSRFKCPE